MRYPQKSQRALFAAGLVAASLAVTACGSSGSPTTTLNTGKVERAIENSSWTQRGQHAVASCPSDVPQTKGLKFSCTAAVGQTKTRFVVTELDAAGHVHYEAP
jgi:hypothetical protein